MVNECLDFLLFENKSDDMASNSMTKSQDGAIPHGIAQLKTEITKSCFRTKIKSELS